MIDELYAIMQSSEYRATIEPADQLQHLFLEMIKVNWAESQEIERNTRFQSQSACWYKSRLFRITASIVHNMVSKNARTNPIQRFIAKRKQFSSAATRHGIQNEAGAFRAFLEAFNSREEVGIEGSSSVGLLVHPEFAFCGASLDRLVKIDGKLYAVEIKCPFNPYVRKQKLRFKMKDKSFYVNISANGIPVLNKKHPYYSQIQMQLLVSNLEAAYFVLYIPPDDIEYFVIQKDVDYVDNMIQSALDVYQEHLLPVFADEVAGI